MGGKEWQKLMDVTLLERWMVMSRGDEGMSDSRRRWDSGPID
jgi:hypothetical protein